MPWWSERVTTHYPPAALFGDDDKITDSEYLRFARIILTEGVPCAFAALPMVFEFGREKAASILNVDPKQISMTGSGRIGYSMNPAHFGRPFDSGKSDFDLFLVDRAIFQSLAREYGDFIARVERSDVPATALGTVPKWLANKATVESTVRKGFIDQKFIPNWQSFPTTRTVAEGAFKFVVNVNNVTGDSTVTSASFRVYRDWDAAIRQIAFSVKSSVNKWRSERANAIAIQ